MKLWSVTVTVNRDNRRYIRGVLKLFQSEILGQQMNDVDLITKWNYIDFGFD